MNKAVSLFCCLPTRPSVALRQLAVVLQLASALCSTGWLYVVCMVNAWCAGGRLWHVCRLAFQSLKTFCTDVLSLWPVAQPFFRNCMPCACSDVVSGCTYCWQPALRQVRLSTRCYHVVAVVTGGQSAADPSAPHPQGLQDITRLAESVAQTVA
jgi:hypothetical protein